MTILQICTALSLMLVVMYYEAMILSDIWQLVSEIFPLNVGAQIDYCDGWAGFF